MSDAARFKISKRLIQLTLISGALMASTAWGFETNYDRGRVDFAGRVTDISCSVALNGGHNAGSGSVWLAPVSLAEVHDRGAGAFMKPQPFTLELSNCQLRYDGGAADKDEIRWSAYRGLMDIWSRRSAMKMPVIWRIRERTGPAISSSRSQPTTIIRWIKAIKLFGRSSTKPRTAGRKGGRWSAYLLITLAT